MLHTDNKQQIRKRKRKRFHHLHHHCPMWQNHNCHCIPARIPLHLPLTVGLIHLQACRVIFSFPWWCCDTITTLCQCLFAATAELGLEVSQALVTLVSVFGYGRLSLLFGLASFTSLRVSDLWDSLCLLEGDRTIKEEVRRRKMRKFADNQTDRQANKHRTFQTLRPL